MILSVLFWVFFVLALVLAPPWPIAPWPHWPGYLFILADIAIIGLRDFPVTLR